MEKREGMLRNEMKTRLQKGGEFDLVVIGGGITGAGIALDAAERGLSVALVEMQDFAAGTSSRSTKLIHGGLRYLKQFEIALVREVGRERAILHRNAPHLVLPEKMLLPVVKGGTYGKLGVSFGLWLYDRLAGVLRSERRKMLSKEKTLQEEPLIRKDILKGAGFYTEYRTDDARLTMEVIRAAIQLGAICLNYSVATGFLYEGKKISGISVEDKLTGEGFQVNGKCVVNAAGPWVDIVRKEDHPVKGKRLHHTKGVHIVFPHAKLPIRHSVYFDVAGGRMVFAIPRAETTYVGTTDTNFKGNLIEPGVTEADVAYLLKAANDMFPSVNLRQDDIISTWSGIRPLIHEDGKSPSELSRKDEIFYADSGLITIAGGKLTGFRKMAERVTDAVLKQLKGEGHQVPEKACGTDRVQLPGGDLKGKSLEDFTKSWAESIDLDFQDVLWLTSRFGSEAAEVLGDTARNLHGESPKDRILKAAAEFCIRREMAVTLTDFFVRRTGMAWFEPKQIASYIESVSAVFAAEYDWSLERKQKEIQDLNLYLHQHLDFKPA